MIRFSLLGLGAAVLLGDVRAEQAPDASDAPRPPVESRATRERLSDWRYRALLDLPAAAASADSARPAAGGLCDFVLTPEVFDAARHDLADLRLYDGAGRELPYALQHRSAETTTAAAETREFNRVDGDDGSRELSLELLDNSIQYNELEISTAGDNFRRRVTLEAGDDGQSWKLLAEGELARLNVSTGESSQRFTQRSLRFTPSRYRFLRARVAPDASVEKKAGDIESVVVRRRVDLPGEYVTREAALQPLYGLPTARGHGSGWLIDLGGNNTPCERVRVEVADDDFARDYELEAGGPPSPLPYANEFWSVNAGEWRRDPGDKTPLEAGFNEVRARRLRLKITDGRNPALRVEKATFSAAARAVVFAPPASKETPVYLYFGNPRAEAPNYDFARKLPGRPPTPPARVALGARGENPDFAPPPEPLTDRAPWIVYVFLAAAIGVLAALIASLAAAALKAADQRGGGQASEPPPAAHAS